MRKIMYNRALFILHKICQTLAIEKEVVESHSKENHLVV